jgi:hypothetical protein
MQLNSGPSPTCNALRQIKAVVCLGCHCSPAEGERRRNAKFVIESLAATAVLEAWPLVHLAIPGVDLAD